MKNLGLAGFLALLLVVPALAADATSKSGADERVDLSVGPPWFDPGPPATVKTRVRASAPSNAHLTAYSVDVAFSEKGGAVFSTQTVSLAPGVAQVVSAAYSGEPHGKIFVAEAKPVNASELYLGDNRRESSLISGASAALAGNRLAAAGNTPLAAGKLEGRDLSAGAAPPPPTALTGPPDDRDGDGVKSTAYGGNDCDDTDPDRYPTNFERPDNKDQDCDWNTIGTLDADGDGFVSAQISNTAPDGRLIQGPDCDDTRNDVRPNAQELPNQVDDNCDGQVDNLLNPSGWWNPAAAR